MRGTLRIEIGLPPFPLPHTHYFTPGFTLRFRRPPLPVCPILPLVLISFSVSLQPQEYRTYKEQCKSKKQYGEWWQCILENKPAGAGGPAVAGAPGELTDKFFDLFNKQFTADQSYETEVAKKMTSTDGVKGLCPLEFWTDNAGPGPVLYTDASAPVDPKVIRFEERKNLMEFYKRTGVLEPNAQHWPECSCTAAADMTSTEDWMKPLVDKCKPYPIATKKIDAYCKANPSERIQTSAVSAAGRDKGGEGLILQVDPLEDKTGMDLSPKGMVKKADSKQRGLCPANPDASNCACQQKNFVSSLGSYLQTRTTGLKGGTLKVGNVFGAECVRSTMNMWAACCAENESEKTAGGIKKPQRGDLGTGGTWLIDGRGLNKDKKAGDAKEMKSQMKPYVVGTGTCSLALTVAKANEKGSCMAYDNTQDGETDDMMGEKRTKYQKMLKRDQYDSQLYTGKDGGSDPSCSSDPSCGPTTGSPGFFEETNRILKTAILETYGNWGNDANAFMHNNKLGIAWGAHTDKKVSPYGNFLPAMTGGKIVDEISKTSSLWLQNLVGGLGRCCDSNKEAAGCKKEDYLLAGTVEVTAGVDTKPKPV